MAMTGTIKFYNGERGYGFIKPDDGGRGVFVEVSAVLCKIGVEAQARLGGLESHTGPTKSYRAVSIPARMALMPTYRFYSIQPDGHIAGPARIVEITDDGDAIKYAKHCLDGLVIEVWEHARQVARLDPPANRNALGDRNG